MVERCGVHVSICVLFVAVVGLTVAATASQIRSRTEPSEYLPRDTPAPTHASSDSSFSS